MVIFPLNFQSMQVSYKAVSSDPSYFDNINAYAVAWTLSFTCSHPSRKETVHHTNNVMGLVIAREKGKSPSPPRRTRPCTPALVMDDKALAFDSAICTLGTQIDIRLTFTAHVKGTVKNATRQIACSRRSAPLLSKGCYAL